jgi:type IV pilus assembly protein PilM
MKFGKSRGPSRSTWAPARSRCWYRERVGTTRHRGAGIERLQADAIVGGDIANCHVVVDAVRSLRERSTSKRRSAAAGFGRDVIVKRIKMDRMREAEAQKVIRWEAEQYVPFDMDSVSMDFKSSTGRRRTPDDVLLACQDGPRRDPHAAARRGRLPTTLIDVDSFAVQTAFEKAYEHAGYGSFCLLNIGREVANLNLIEQTVPSSPATFRSERAGSAEALVKELGSRSTTRPGFDRARWTPPRDALKEPIESLVAPVERARSISRAASPRRVPFDEVVFPAALLPGLRGGDRAALDEGHGARSAARTRPLSSRAVAGEHGGPRCFGRGRSRPAREGVGSGPHQPDPRREEP